MEEWVDVVNEQNEVVGSAARSEMRKQKLWHRASYIVIRDFSGLIYVQKRTATKDYCPSMLDACCGGVMQSGEDVLLSAYRELAEEMGISTVELTDHGWFQYTDDNNHVWGALYSCVYEGTLLLQKEEVESVQKLSLDEIFSRTDEFTPDSLFAIKRWRSLLSV